MPERLDGLARQLAQGVYQEGNALAVVAEVEDLDGLSLADDAGGLVFFACCSSLQS